MSSTPRTHSYGRQGDELLNSSNYSPMTQHNPNPYTPAHESGRGPGLPSNPASAGSLPGQLQAGRPGPATANTAPSTVPVLPPLSTQNQQYTGPGRASTSNHSHAYSRSSPAAAYPEDSSKYTSPASHKYMPAQTPQNASYSPLGLADIRPQTNSGDGLPTPHPFQDASSEPSSCNYLAPWAVYAFDWCKWPVQQQGLGDAAGKIAVGSYLEDGHNYVSLAPNGDCILPTNCP